MDRAELASNMKYFMWTLRVNMHKRRRRGLQPNWLCKTSDITNEYLCDLWERQDGKCCITGVAMLLPHCSPWRLRGWPNKLPANASLDRINSKVGYVIGNVQFVCCTTNYAKNNFTPEEMKDFNDKVVDAKITNHHESFIQKIIDKNLAEVMIKKLQENGELDEYTSS